MQKRTGVMRELGGQREQSVEVVWTHEEKGGGLIGEENSRIQCERCEFEKKDTKGMHRQCKKSAE